jgi:hypothetical protein
MDAGVDQGAANSRARPRRALTLLWPYPGRQLGAGFNPLAFKGRSYLYLAGSHKYRSWNR